MPDPRDRSEREETLNPAELMVDPRLQFRVRMSEEAIAEYGATLKERPLDMPPLRAVRIEDGRVIVWDGFHTYYGALHNKLPGIRVWVRKGTPDDAILLAAGANATHGIPRTAADRRKAIRAILGHPEFGRFSNVRIGEVCRVDEKLVREVRKDWDQEQADREAAAQAKAEGKPTPPKAKPAPRVGRDGKLQAATKKRKASGKPKFRLADFRKPFGQVVRAVDDLYRGYGLVGEDGKTIKRDADYRKIEAAMKAVEKLVTKKLEAVSKQKAAKE